jgi:hypothetical protein
MRDVLVCTVDRPDTYLTARARIRALHGLVRSAVMDRQRGAKKRLSPVA